MGDWDQMDAWAAEQRAKAAAALPPWFKPSKAAKTQETNVRRGKHPMGAALLGEPGKTCGGCAHMTKHGRAKVYRKCAVMKMTHGPGTDIRDKWHACTEWTAPTKGDQL